MLKKTMVALVIAGSVGTAYAATTLEGPKVVFDATYTSISPAGTSTVRMISDGKGHMRTETSTNGQKFISIMDYPKKESVTLMEAQKMAMKMTLKASTDVHDETSAKQANAKSLGNKVVNGHPSHGWQYTTAGGTTETWTGDDIKYLVKSETKTPQGKVTMDLKSFSNKLPSGDLFSIPAGYKIMAMPGQ